MKEIRFSPVTRLSGLLSIDVMVDGQVVVDAKVKGNQYRGFEHMLVGRDIRDAPYFTERICGICSLAHGTVSNYVLDTIFADSVPAQGQLLRNIMLGLEFLQNHIRHFYGFGLPDYIELPPGLPYQGPVVDRRLSPRVNQELVDHYTASFGIAAKAHEAQTIFGGKAPHQHGMVHGGVAVVPGADKILHATGLVREVKEFITSSLLPDTDLLARCYPDYYEIGKGPRRFLSFGLFRIGEDHDMVWRPATVEDQGITLGIDLQLIKEDIASSWYEDAEALLSPTDLVTADPYKEGAYTFVKAVHYHGLPYEVGPLARLVINKGYGGGPSTMDRIVARSMETGEIADLILKWLDLLTPSAPVLKRNPTPSVSEAVGMTDAPRGALLHEAIVEDGLIRRYGIITPTMWNFSPLNMYTEHGPAETALIGTFIRDIDNPVEIGRIVRAFDPCLSCGTHLIQLRQQG
ncbi:MAG: nickel-dependent hydrogenase large subunit [Firmicutes bacterium]|nr:nickel-dependent hydrogenase large subunit [Bacillota bacterium]